MLMEKVQMTRVALAMQELGARTVFARVDSERTGGAFNAVLAVVDMPTLTGNPYSAH